MVHRIHRLVGKYIKFAQGHEKALLLFMLGIFLLSVFISLRLELRSDLKELLPANSESVKQLNLAIEKVGGVGSLIVVAQGPNVDANKKFMDDLAVNLSELPDGLIRYVNYKATDIREFYEDHFLYYINAKDLDLFYNRLKERIDYEKFRRTPLFLELGEDGDVAPPEMEFGDIKERNEKNYQAPVSTVDDYYGGEWGRMLIMIIRPYGATVTIDSAKNLTLAVESVVNKMDPASYDSGLTVGYCGNVKSSIEEYETLKHDIFSTALLCVLLVALSIVVYFLRVRVVFLLGATLVFAIALTFALTEIFIGYFNAQTAFLGSIIIGTGINYGIILLARYLEERKKNKNPANAMEIALEGTVKPTFLAAATTAVAFVVLLIARIRGLSQFGFIGAVGVMLCWLSTVFVLPILTLESEKIYKFVKPRLVPSRKSALFDILARVAVKFPRFWIITAAVLVLIASVLVIRFAPNAIEYDFTKMRNQVSVTVGTEALEKKVSQLFRNSMTPSVVLVDSIEEGKQVCDAVVQRNAMLSESEQRVGSCHSILDLLPTNQEAKLPIIAKIDRLLSQGWVREVKGDLKEKVDKVKKSILGRALAVDDLPDILARHFEDLEGRRGAVVFINPRPGMLLSDGRNLMKYADTIRDIDLGGGKILHAVSEAIIFSDLIDITKKEAPWLTIISFIAVVLFVFYILKHIKISAVIVGGLVWGVLVMIGVAAYLDIKINFFNFIVLPLTFGIGVDYGINVAMRIQEEGAHAAANAVRHTGGAVILCSVTTIIGYYVLTTANNKALATFGVAAVIGEITCIVAAILLVPSIIVYCGRMGRQDGRAE